MQAVIDSDVLQSIVTQLWEDVSIFEEYGRLHAAKGTPDGAEKAARNFEYANRIKMVLTRYASAPARDVTPCMDAVHHAIDTGYNNGHNPVALIVTDSFLVGWHKELTSLGHGIESPQDMVRGSYMGLIIYVSDDYAVTGVLAVGEGSSVLERARRYA